MRFGQVVLRVIIVSLAALVITAPFGDRAVASPASTPNESQQTAAAPNYALIRRADPYIKIVNHRFQLDQRASQALTPAQMAVVLRTIRSTNEAVAAVEGSGVNLTSDDQTIRATEIDEPRTIHIAAEGRTGIEWRWWHYHAWISKTHLTWAAAGIAIAGVLIPEPLVTKVFAILGILGSVAPHGVEFDFIPTPPMAPPIVWNVRWQ